MAQAREPNPFRPGFNQQPAVLVGRDAVLASAAEALDIAALDGRTPRPLVLVGPRGVGKTVALVEIGANAAAKYGWPTIHVELRPKIAFSRGLVEHLDHTTTLLDGATVEPGGRVHVTGGKVIATVFGVGGEIDLSRGGKRGPAVPLDAALTRCLEVASERGAGVVLSLDELQLADRGELADLTAALQSHVPDGWPLVVVAAGLPGLRDPSRSVTYLERAEWHELGLLSLADSIAALTGPALQAGRAMDPEAAEMLARAAGGYPYAVQVVGHHAWRASTGARTIGRAHALAARVAAQADLSAGLYASRWDGAAPKEQEYLRALAELAAHSPEVTGADVATHLGKSSSDVSYLRDRLLKKGTLFTRGRALQFVTPGMGDWILLRENGA